MAILKEKVAVIFAGTGAIGGAVAQSFAQKGAKVYVTGNDLGKVRVLADKIKLDGGWEGRVNLRIIIQPVPGCRIFFYFPPAVPVVVYI